MKKILTASIKNIGIAGHRLKRYVMPVALGIFFASPIPGLAVRIGLSKIAAHDSQGTTTHVPYESPKLQALGNFLCNDAVAVMSP